MSASDSDTTRAAEIGDVPQQWVVAPLSLFISRVTYGFTNPMPTTDEGPFLVTAKDVHDGRIDYSTARRTSWDAYRNAVTDKSRPRVGDILLTKDGSIGRVAVCDRPGVCINQSVALIQPNERTDSRFLKYLLEAPHYQDRMEGDSDGTTIKHIYITRVDKMQVAVPPLEEQRAIAHILGTLDDKIELNRRMSETLEAMARTLFKSWFVDFDPVRAKAEGRDPGLPKPLADLFPARLVDSELGEIPEGWEVGTLESLASIQGGKQLPTEECERQGPYPVYGANGIMGFAERTTHGGFVIAFGRVGAYCGSVHWTYGGAWINNNASSVVPARWPEFVLQAMLTVGFEGMRTGSAQPFIPSSSLASMGVIRPGEAVLDSFCSIAAPLRRREQAAIVESRTLAALRDTLLPKLISGELRVKDAEQFAGGAI